MGNNFCIRFGSGFRLFNNRLSGSLDIYKSYTRNVLFMNRKIPSTNGYSDVMENIGKTENFGIDITLNSVNIQKKNLPGPQILRFLITKRK